MLFSMKRKYSKNSPIDEPINKFFHIFILLSDSILIHFEQTFHHQ